MLERHCAIILLTLIPTAVSFASDQTAAREVLDPAPRPQDWAALAKLPDWSGTWVPVPEDPFPLGRNEPKWQPQAARQIEAQKAADKAGRPQNVFLNCLPDGMPGFILMTVAATEFLFTPGRVTLLGEFDGNRLRRIYTDGRGHPEDPDLTFNGHSIGHWERDTLVVDTVAMLPQVYLPLGQAVALPNNGDMHIVERIYLIGPNTLKDELEITAPHVLTEPWKIARRFKRSRERRFSIVEASCRQGDFVEGRDANDNAVFLPLDHEEGGAPLPPENPAAGEQAK